MHFWRLFFACVGLAIGAAADSSAQSESALLPGPVTSVDLLRMIRPLEVSAEQQVVIESLHADYRSRWSEAMEGPASAFVAAHQLMNGFPFDPIKPEIAHRFVQSHTAVMASADGLDDTLFNSIGQHLTEEQRTGLPRILLSRDLQRLQQDAIISDWLGENTILDIDALLDETGLDPAARHAVQPSVDDFHRALAASLRDIQNKALRARVEHVRRTSEPTGNDDEQFQSAAASWLELTEPVQTQTIETRRMMRRGVAGIAAMLPAPQGVAFRRLFFAEVYPQSRLNGTTASLYRRAAASMNSLTDDQRQALDQAFTDYQAQCDALLEPIADAADAQRSCVRPHYFDQRAYEQAGERIGELMVKQSEFSEQAQQAMRAAIGADQQANADRAFHRLLAKETGAVMGDEPLISEDQDSIESIETFLAPPISEDNLNTYSKLLGTTEEQLAPMWQVHAPYVALYKRTRNEAALAMREHHIAFMPRVQEDGSNVMAFATTDEVVASHQTQTHAIESLVKLDAAFLDDVELGLPEGLVEQRYWAVRLSRAYSSLARDDRLGMADLRSYEFSVNMMNLPVTARLPESALTTWLPIVQSKAAPLHAALSAHFKAALASHRANQAWMAAGSSRQKTTAEAREARTQEQRSAELAALKARRELVQLNRSIMDEFEKTDPQASIRIRSTYDRLAFPLVSSDDSSAHQLLAKALELEGLEAPQRKDLEALAAEFTPASEMLTKSMIDLNTQWDELSQYVETEYQQREVIKGKFDSLKQDRDELNAATRRTLQRVLKPEQLSAIGFAP